MSAARSLRRGAVRVHRWTGLALAGFLVVVAATGAMLPFMDDLERMIAPERYVRPPARPVDWLGLRAVAERRSGGDVDIMPLELSGGAAPAFYPTAKAGRAAPPFDEMVLDPATGREISRARIGDLGAGKAQVLPFLYRLHQQLALGEVGVWLVGIVALAWTVDCFVGFYLTLPVAPPDWWRRWRKAWAVRWPTPSAFRLHFDLHRAGGLWFWAMMFVFAWTGVAFNLPSVYGPVMHALTGFEAPADPPKAAPHTPRLDWAQGLATVRVRAAQAAQARGFRIEREREMRYLRASNRYALGLRTDRDRSDAGENSWVDVDADTGALVSVELPTGERVGNTIDYWLGMIHEASVGGLAVRILVSASGAAIVMVTATGVLIWWRKRDRPRRTRAA